MASKQQHEAAPAGAGLNGQGLIVSTFAAFAIIWFVVATPAHAASVDVSRIPLAAGKSVDFAKDIKPLFEASCVKCHGPEKAKNAFRLDSRARALAGGDNGIDIIPGDSAKSPMVHYVAGLVADLEMPPKGKGEPLTPKQIGLLRAWIDQGARWDVEETVAKTAGEQDKSNWWSLKPLVRPTVPVLSNPKAAFENPIDAFVLAKLREKGLHSSPEADRRTLIRRLYFDLIGLPPTPEEINSFVADKDSKAYEKLVDRLLASPRYGERWARHWLDVVHYGETHGYDKDQPRPNAWPYRDYVIRSFNEDKPFTRFAQEQIAGDLLFPGTRDGFEALGFISAGPWDLIGHAEVPESKMDGKVARHLDRDDMVVNTIQTFNSLTVQCAQCHNHKFDPISQEDYYSLQAVFAAVDRADKNYDPDVTVARQRKALEEKQTQLTMRQKEIDGRILTRAGALLQQLDRKIAALPKTGKSSDAFGYHSNIEKDPTAAKWVQVDLGRSVPLGSIVLHPCNDDFNGIGEGFGFPVRYKVELADDPDFKQGVALLGDFTGDDVPNPKLKPQSVDVAGRTGRYIRVTATKLAPRQNDYIFALAELSALTADGKNAAAGGTVTALDSIEAPARWRKSNLTDGFYPGANLAQSSTAAELQQERKALLAKAALPEETAKLAEIERNLASVKKEQTRLPAQSTVYIAAVHKGSGAFAGTGASGGKPRPIHILNRGNVLKAGKEVGPGTLSCLQGLPSRFDLAPTQNEGERRAALAQWLTRVDNPLTWRSIVNRVWQYHFGRGLVETPNDFGRMGGLPTHPELLDWLAVEFRDGGQSLKVLHKLIVTSETYRQSSAVTHQSKPGAPADDGIAKALTTDSDNRYLWRQNRRKLEAEAVRDAVLAVSGKLNLKMGGPSFQDFVIEHPEHSPHYEYPLHDPEDPKSHRRSIYRFIVRSQQQPFMTVLDCADPSMQVGKRNESLSPLQALSLLNNPFVLTMSKHFAAKLEKGGGDLAAKVRRGHLETLGRIPTAEDQQALTDYAQQFGLTNYCRLLLNLNEFAFAD
jgi:mono/diheme cytochrome c family protein